MLEDQFPVRIKASTHLVQLILEGFGLPWMQEQTKTVLWMAQPEAAPGAELHGAPIGPRDAPGCVCSAQHTNSMQHFQNSVFCFHFFSNVPADICEIHSLSAFDTAKEGNEIRKL